MDPFQLGITGGIGSGKSCVGRLLASYCLAPLINIDSCCKALLEIRQPGWNALRNNFGDMYFLDNGEINRPFLRERLFGDGNFRQQVDALLHPLARTAMRAAVQKYAAATMVFVEIPLLYEAGWQHDVDAVLVVYARRGVRCGRIMRRDGVSRRSAAQAIAAQMKLEEKSKLAEYVIDNSGAWISTRKQVIDLGDKLPDTTLLHFIKKKLDSGT